MLKTLIISHNEICYNARLLKAADYLASKGCDVTVFNPVTGIAREEVYRKIVAAARWRVVENDISKRTFRSWFRWLAVSVIHTAIRLLRDWFSVRAGFMYYLSKGLVWAPAAVRARYDVIIIHLVDHLPFAAALRARTGALLVYDSQEYFRGQYRHAARNSRRWVHDAEEQFIRQADIVLATTTVMLDRICRDYDLKCPCFRVRNCPPAGLPTPSRSVQAGAALRLVWHGMAVYYNNRRGLHIIVRAVARCKMPVMLVIQGNMREDQRRRIEDDLRILGIAGSVRFAPVAEPDSIVQSLSGFDVGVIGELPAEENQQLTSSNKLFDYIAGGLAVVAPELPGLRETVSAYNVGLMYEPGNIDDMAAKLDRFASDSELLLRCRENSAHAGKKELFWEHDYDPVWNAIRNMKEASFKGRRHDG